MYYYIVDPSKLSQKEFERVQNVLYSSLSEYKIAGEIVRVTGMRTILQLVENAFAHETKTIVAVGNDETLHEVINAVNKREVTIGYIPIVNSEIGEIFGIKDLQSAIKTIAFRRIQDIDLGVVNGQFFLSKISFGSAETPISIKISADEQFSATQTVISGLIVNSRENVKPTKIGNPTDGLLDVLLLSELSRWNKFFKKQVIAQGLYEELPGTSILHFKQVRIHEPSGVPIMLNTRIITRTPATITIVPKALRMIVGKARSF